MLSIDKSIWKEAKSLNWLWKDLETRLISDLNYIKLNLNG